MSGEGDKEEIVLGMEKGEDWHPERELQKFA